jgi:hypothetical protein
LSLQELSERHGRGQLARFQILVSTMTFKHDKTKIGNANASETTRKAVWLLALSVDEEDEKDKIGRSFSLDTRFDVVEGDIFVGFTVV